MRTPLAALDFALRLAFFAAAPFATVLVAALFPITGALAQIGLAVVVFFAAETARRLASRSKALAAVLGAQLEFDTYYREHPPRPFLYYVFYPLLLPYWLVSGPARREFLLYKGYTLASFALLLGMLAAQYFVSFPPELGLREFAPIALGTFVAESVVVLSLLMPLVTTVVHFHLIGAPKRLGVVLGVGALSVGAAAFHLARPRDPIVSYAARTRLRARTKKESSAAIRAQSAALRAGWKALARDRADVDRDGKVEGAPLEAAHAALEAFYKHDEAFAFDLWLSRTKERQVLVVYFEARDRRRPIWLAMEKSGEVVMDAKRLPRGAFVAMKQASDAPE